MAASNSSNLSVRSNNGSVGGTDASSGTARASAPGKPIFACFASTSSAATSISLTGLGASAVPRITFEIYSQSLALKWEIMAGSNTVWYTVVALYIEILFIYH